MHNIQKRECCQTVKFQCERSSELGNIMVLNEKNPYIRNTRDGTMIKLDVNKTGPVLS